MNRIIKFRAWNNPTQEMIYSDDFETLLEFFHEIYPLNKMSSLMEFTSLFDKNNKEIYEGDIISLDVMQVSITFNDGAFQMIMNSNQGRSDAMQERTSKFEIIGNIYENESLIK
jgi:hypothetical protein